MFKTLVKRSGSLVSLSILFAFVLQITACGGGGSSTGGGGGTGTALSVTTSTLAAGTVGTAYSATLAATGGTAPYTWAVSSGTLPSGLSLSAAGVISGTPDSSAVTAAGLVFTATDSAKNTANSGGITLTINPAALVVSTSSLAGGTVGTTYSLPLTATGGTAPYVWSLKSGTLPAGLSLSAAGVIGGTPTAPGTASGLTFQVTDSNTKTAVSSTLSLTVVPAALVVTTTSLPSGAVNSAYSATLTATGGTGPYTWALTSGTLPAGVTLSGGVLSGTPTASGTFSGLIFTVTDANNTHTASSSLSITITPLPALAVTTSSLPNGTVNSAYSATLSATGGAQPYTWALTSGTLPTGVLLSSSGALSGTPTTPGTFSGLVFTVTDSLNNHATSGSLSIVIAPLPLVVTTTSLPSDDEGTAYNQTLTASGGVAPYTWIVESGTLPAGLTLSSAGAITGTPTTPGIEKNLVFQVTDSTNATALSGSINLQIYNAVGCSAGSESSLGTEPYAFLLKAFDGIGDVVVTAGSFTPDGLGNVVAGAEDVNGSTVAPASFASLSGTYSLGPDNRGCLTLTTSAGSTTYRYALGGYNGTSFTTGRIIEFDDNTGTGTRGSGILRLQNSSAISTGLTGGYGFAFSGMDTPNNQSQLRHFGIVGTVEAATGNFTSVAFDFNDGGTLARSNPASCAPSCPVSNYSAASPSTGRGTATIKGDLNPGSFDGQYVFYIVSSTEVIFVSSDPIATNPVAGGEAFSTTGNYSLTDLTGNFIAQGAGYGSTPVGTQAAISTASLDGAGNVTGGTLYQDKSGNVTQLPVNGSYSVDTYGRIVITGQFITPLGYDINNTAGINAALIGGDTSPIVATLEQQTSFAPTTGNFSVGTVEDEDYSTVNEVGIFDVGTSSFTGIEDLSAPTTPFLTINQSLAATSYTFNSAGISTDFGTGATNVAVTNGNKIYFIDTTVANPRVTVVVQ